MNGAGMRRSASGSLKRSTVPSVKSVGNDYPVAIKLGIKDDTEVGLSLEEGAEVASRLARAGIDAIEISGGIPTKTSGAKPQQYSFRGIRRPISSLMQKPFVRRSEGCR